MIGQFRWRPGRSVNGKDVRRTMFQMKSQEGREQKQHASFILGNISFYQRLRTVRRYSTREVKDTHAANEESSNLTSTSSPFIINPRFLNIPGCTTSAHRFQEEATPQQQQDTI